MSLSQKDLDLLGKLFKQFGDLKREFVAEQEFSDQRFKDISDRLNKIPLPTYENTKIPAP